MFNLIDFFLNSWWYKSLYYLWDEFNFEPRDLITISLAVAAFVTATIALYGSRYKEWLTRPKIKISFNKNSDRCIRKGALAQNSIQEEGLFVGVERYYYRLKIINKGGYANKVRVKVDIYFDGKERCHFEPQTLKWVTTLKEDEENLAKGEINYINLCSWFIKGLPALNPVNLVGASVKEDINGRCKLELDKKYQNININRKIRVELFDFTPRAICWDLPKSEKLLFKVIVCGENFMPIVRYFLFITPENKPEKGNLKRMNFLWYKIIVKKSAVLANLGGHIHSQSTSSQSTSSSDPTTIKIE